MFPILRWSSTKDLVHGFIHSFCHSFTHSFIHSFLHSFIHSFVQRFGERIQRSLPKWTPLQESWTMPLSSPTKSAFSPQLTTENHPLMPHNFVLDHLPTLPFSWRLSLRFRNLKFRNIYLFFLFNQQTIFPAIPRKLLFVRHLLLFWGSRLN